jgi:hypothetical protein
MTQTTNPQVTTESCELAWTRAKQFTGWRGRSGRLNAPVFVVEYHDDGWVLRSTLPGYASARWTFQDLPGAFGTGDVRATPPAVVSTLAEAVLASFLDKLLDRAPTTPVPVLEAGEHRPLGQPYGRA